MRINELPSATSVANADVLAIDTANGTYQVPRSVLAPAPYVATITSGQWSGSGSDYYISVNASNVTADSILVPNYDNASKAYLKGPVWCVPAAGSFTIHTSALPTGTVTIMVQFPGIMGEAQYQVLADVYSTSQAVAKADIVNDLTNNDSTKVASQAEAYSLALKTYSVNQSATSNRGTIEGKILYNNYIAIINLIFTSSASATNSPGVLGASNFKPIRDAALSCIDITSGIASAITGSVPAGISTSGTIFLKEIVSGHIYAITGAYMRG